MLTPLSCGFKVLDRSQSNNFSIKSISTDGHKRIGYKIKNNLLVSSGEEQQNQIIINLKVDKSKSIKEKNIKNEVKKYQINLKVNLTFYRFEETEDKEVINLNITGDYSVDQVHSRTIANEKKLIDNLTENISEKLIDEIDIRLNDI